MTLVLYSDPNGDNPYRDRRTKERTECDLLFRWPVVGQGGQIVDGQRNNLKSKFACCGTGLTLRVSYIFVGAKRL